MTETMAYRYSSEMTQQELSNEYQHDMVKLYADGGQFCHYKMMQKS